jgi:hypothetical protein
VIELVGKLRGTSPVRRRALRHALPAVVLLRVALTVVPFRSAQRLVARSARMPGHRNRSLSEDDLAWAVETASRRVPRATCLTQALALQLLLNREGRPSELRLGVAKRTDGGLEAHAWLESGGRILIGGGSHASRFTPLPELPEPEPQA